MSFVESPFCETQRTQRDGPLSQLGFQRASECGRTMALNSIATILGTTSAPCIRFSRLYLSDARQAYTHLSDTTRTGSSLPEIPTSILHGAVVFDVMQVARHIGASYARVSKATETELARLRGHLIGCNLEEFGEHRVVSSQLRYMARVSDSNAEANSQSSLTASPSSGPIRRRRSRNVQESNYRRNMPSNSDSVAPLAISPLAAVLLAYALLHHMSLEKLFHPKETMSVSTLVAELQSLKEHLYLWRADAMGDHGDLHTGRAYREVPLTKEISRVDKAIDALAAPCMSGVNVRIAIANAAAAGWDLPMDLRQQPLHEGDGVVELARLPQYVPGPPTDWLISMNNPTAFTTPSTGSQATRWPSARSMWSSTFSQASSSSASSVYSNDSLRSYTEQRSPMPSYSLTRFAQLCVDPPSM